ncbi:MAG: hypothetical protein NUV82_00140, partial [Candidatus Komeilibacteria bacterium]|nr:hypothetical protein [Candidatus Komeilibacteria bacterium]
LLGGVVTTLITLAPILLSGSWSAFWQQNVVFNGYYAADFLKYIPEMPAHYLAVLWKNWWLPLLLILSTLVIKQKNWWLLWLLVLASWVSVFTTPIGHYYLLLMPWLALLAAGGLNFYLKKTERWGKSLSNAISAVAILVILIAMHTQIVPQFFLTPTQLNTWIYGYGNPFVESVLVADKIQSLTTPTDKILVAGSEPQIYYYAARLSATKFDITYPLIINTPIREDLQRQAVADLRKNPPAVIVYSQRGESGLWEAGVPRLFIDYIHTIMKEDFTLIGSYYWRNDELIWTESPSEDELGVSSLIIFLRQ